jgi:hypothetical protein
MGIMNPRCHRLGDRPQLIEELLNMFFLLTLMGLLHHSIMLTHSISAMCAG